MFSRYTLKLSKDFFNSKLGGFNYHKIIGESHLANEFYDYRTKLENNINSDTINGSKLEDEWFPSIDADIFISHSHMDKDLANALAGWIHTEFNLRAFVDSNVWGYSKNLLDDINSKYSNEQKSDNFIWYDYQSCNYASQHVNMMLSVALQKMIDNVECVIILNTDNFVTVFDEDNQFSSTYSPWIYFEIMCTKTVRQKSLSFYRDHTELRHFDESFNPANSLKISYDVSLGHLVKLEEKDLDKWKREWNCEKYNHSLDALYSFTYPNDMII